MTAIDMGMGMSMGMSMNMLKHLHYCSSSEGYRGCRGWELSKPKVVEWLNGCMAAMSISMGMDVGMSKRLGHLRCYSGSKGCEDCKG